MKKYLALVVCGLSLTGHVAAQTGKPYFVILNEARVRAIHLCGPATEAVQYSRMTMTEPAREAMGEMVITVSWTGGCADGKRDGVGVLNLRDQRSFDSGVSVKTEQLEGAFIQGRQIGLWCTTQYQFSIDGVPRRELDYTGCRVYAPGAPAGQFRKLADGRWQRINNGVSVEPPVFLAAGTLETLSAEALAGATGATVAKTKVVMQSQALDGLVRGAKIELQSSAAPISLKGKRVAVVLSSQTIAELERFKRERQALISASASIEGKNAQNYRARFIAASNPDRLLAIVAKAVLKHAREVLPADDFADLQKGGFDYALVVHWKSLTRFDLLGKYASFPGGDYNDWKAGIAPALAGESLSGFLISPELKAVRTYDAAPYVTMKYKETYRPDDEKYMSELLSFFEGAWGKSLDDLGNTGSHFDARLKAEY